MGHESHVVCLRILMFIINPRSVNEFRTSPISVECSNPAELREDGGKAVSGNTPEDSGGVACSGNAIEAIWSHSVE
ncbi:unnamed protein product [Clonostachys rhizophaga]|uniref:Uncharacterized protein n=1 Tax=Clonostachys rhizophaga TaxID=160324 RepID=A0A9N9YNK8_9HYPO|nr:unnamed protein product [Clonostachys rhizophaga]